MSWVNRSIPIPQPVGGEELCHGVLQACLDFYGAVHAGALLNEIEAARVVRISADKDRIARLQHLTVLEECDRAERFAGEPEEKGV